ncbi:MAG: sensor histidine kinase [Bacteroidota bacterium]
MVQLYPATSSVFDPIPSRAASPPMHLLVLDDRSAKTSCLSGVLSHSSRRIYQLDTLGDALDALTTIPACVLLVTQGFFKQLSEEWLAEVKHIAPDVSVLLCNQSSCTLDELAHYYDWGIIDVIPADTEARIVQTKIAVHETLYKQRHELRRMNDRLQSANKQLEEYVYIVSHDLKAPLRGLSSLSQFIEEELGEQITTEVYELLNMMKSRTDRMQQMIDGILHYSRMSNNRCDKETVDLNLLINNIIDLICPPSNVRIEYPDQLPVVEIEKIKIHEVLQNLILNAIKHNDKSDIFIQIQFNENGNWYEFSVKDNGKGIKPEHQEKVFGLFQTLLPKDKSEGTGLGLTIVKKIVEQQEGRVSVESELGKGSSFKFTWRK